MKTIFDDASILLQYFFIKMSNGVNERSSRRKFFVEKFE